MSAPVHHSHDQGSSDGLLRSAICHLDADAGRLTYRGYDVAELAQWSSFEETAWLLVAGTWPTRTDLSAFKRAWLAAQKLRTLSRKFLRSIPLDANELTVLRTAVSALPLEEDVTMSREAGKGLARDVTPSPSPTLGARSAKAPELSISPEALRLMARIPAIVAERLRLRRGGEPAPKWGRDGVAAGFLRVATGVEPPDDLIRAFDGALILRADNELNPGTFAARVAASTGADLTSCVTSALGALAGPKHSGHTIAVARLLESIGDPRQAASAVSQALATTTKPAGFGHPVYKGEDPRTPMARRLAEMAALATSRDDLFESAQAVEQEVHRQSGLYANVDYYLTVIYLAAGLPVAAFAPIFAMARTPGWIAHVLEQQEDPELIRPRARYEGERNQKLPARRQRASPAQPKQPKPTPT